MGLQIATNVAALNAQRNLSNTGVRMGKVLEKLSSGFRINRAADDAAGLAISEKMRAQIRGNSQAVRNAQDGISMLQTAEGALDEVHSILQRMRELGVQAANGTYANSSAERTSIGEELMQLRTEIDRIAEATQFNGQKLLNGNLSTSVDAASEIQVSQAIGAAALTELDVSGATAGTVYTFTSGGAGQITLTKGSGAGAVAQTVAVAANSNDSQVLNFSALGISLTITGTETAANIISDLTAGATDTITTAAASNSASLQIGANTSAADNTLTLAFAGMDSVTIGLTAVIFAGAATAVADQTAAHNVIDAVDSAIGNVNSQRGTLGAAQNRLEHTIASLGVAVENLSAAESRIRDADVAELSSKMVSQQILQQAGISVLAQANQAPQAALNLLR